MHPHISRLYNLSKRPERLIIGLMSGTSLDGLDIALCKIGNQGLATTAEILKFDTIAYEDDFGARVRTVFSKRDVDLQQVCLLNPWIALHHAQAVLRCLDNWNYKVEEIDLIASHGQTIYHSPRSFHQQAEYGNATLQIGDGDHLATATGIITVSDFRQKHIAAGGEGAPLAMYGDYLIFGSPEENRIMLNIGGIANLTWLPASQLPGEVFSSDIGPGNTIMDALVCQQNDKLRFDVDARLARSGKVSDDLLGALKKHPFFELPLPKTVGPELFNLEYLAQAKTGSNTVQLSLTDQLATLNRFTADCITNLIQDITAGVDSFSVYVSGGGIHNSLMLENIAAKLPGTTISSSEALGIHPDAKEALLFALLANECVAGEACNLGSADPEVKALTMGKISFPD